MRSSICSITTAGSRGCPASATTCETCSRAPILRAKLALDYFVYRIALFAGMLAAALGGIDGFVFTAGVGENAPAIREAVAERLSWLGPSSTPRRTPGAPAASRASDRGSPATSSRPMKN